MFHLDFDSFMNMDIAVSLSVNSWLILCKVWEKKFHDAPHHFFSLISALYRLIIFFSIKRCGILSFISHYPAHISIDMQNNFFFFIQLRSDVFSEHSFNFLSSVLIHWCKFCIYIRIRGSMKSTAYDSIMLLFLTFRTTSMAF